MFCTNCGKEVNKGNFCSNCGNKIYGNSTNGRKITLTVARKKRMIGCAIPFPIFIDDVEVGKLGNGKSLTYEVTEGIHKVMIKCIEKKVEQEIIVNSNTNSVEILFRARMGLAAAIAEILDVKYD